MNLQQNMFVVCVQCTGVQKLSFVCSHLFINGPYHSFCMFEPNIFNFHTCNITDNHFPKHTTGTTSIGFSSFWYAIKINLLTLETFLG
ncbi:hypothetical protein LDENG_00205910 [Lucifuga dentata]|nr:hypothetical protein LDENG_00205910 [Lucifuga dentata]